MLRLVLELVSALLRNSIASLDWPNPRGPARLVVDWIGPEKTYLIGKDFFPPGSNVGPEYDYPNPRGPTPAITQKTWTWNQTYLIGLDSFPPGGFGKALTYDYPNPRGPLGTISLRSWDNTQGFQARRLLKPRRTLGGTIMVRYACGSLDLMTDRWPQRVMTP